MLSEGLWEILEVVDSTAKGPRAVLATTEGTFSNAPEAMGEPICSSFTSSPWHAFECLPQKDAFGGTG